ncbi:MAG: hypothetical protein WBK20_08220 [Spirochaetota bacterium]
MQSENLLNKAPGGSGSSRLHDGSLTTDAPDVMWGTDGKKFFNHRDGWCWLFAVIDHFNSGVIGYSVVKKGDRFEATRAVQNAIQNRFGALDKDIAKEEQLFKLHDFATLEEAEKAIGKFICAHKGTSY